MIRRGWWVPLFVFAMGGCAEIQLPIPIQTGPGLTGADTYERPPDIQTDAMISGTLINVLETKDRLKPDLRQAEGTPLGEILKLGSPIGYSLRNRFLNLGVPIAEGLARNSDPVFREKLIELARWDRVGEVRAAGLVAIGQLQEAAHYDIFREALVHLDPAVRFGAMEALLIWGHKDQTVPLLAAASEKDYEPILRVYAAAGLARFKDPRGLEKLRAFLDDGSWLVRAMAGRYLGEYGKVEDYKLLLTRIGREQSNDFVVAEYCIAALKLYGKKSDG